MQFFLTLHELCALTLHKTKRSWMCVRSDWDLSRLKALPSEGREFRGPGSSGKAVVAACKNQHSSRGNSGTGGARGVMAAGHTISVEEEEKGGGGSRERRGSTGNKAISVISDSKTADSIHTVRRV